MRCMRQQTHDCETCYLSSPECGGATNVPDPEQNAYICLPALCIYELSRIKRPTSESNVPRLSQTSHIRFHISHFTFHISLFAFHISHFTFSD